MVEKQDLMSRTAGGLALALAVALIALVLGPVSAALAEEPPHLTIELAEGSPTNNRVPQLHGHTDDAFDEVTVKIEKKVGGGGPPPISLSPIGEEWSVSPAQELQDGVYTAQAAQTNAAGETKESVEFTVDTTPPTLTLTQPPALSNNTKPSFSGTSTDSTTVLVRIFSSGHEVASASGAGGSSWTAGNESGLPAGTYTAQAEQFDQAGNTSSSNAVTFTIKTQGPAVTLNPVPTPTNIATPTLTGKAGIEPENSPVTVRIFTSPSGNVAQTLTAHEGGTGWSVLAAHLADGAYTAHAEQSDQAGNVGKSPTSSSFVVDTVAPSVSLVPGSKEKHTPSPFFEGSAGTARGDLPGVTLKIYAGASVSGVLEQETSVVSKNAKWAVGSLAPLRNGTYTAQAEQADEAGNHGLSTPPSTFTISSNGPTVTLTPVAAETNDATPSFNGSAGLAGGEVRLLLYAGRHAEGPVARTITVRANGSNWSTSPVTPALPDATYTAIAEECATGPVAKCEQEQEHLGTSQDQATFTVDTVSPTVSLSSPSNGSSAGGGAQLVEGAGGTAAGDASTISVRLASGPSIGGQTLQTRVVVNEAGRWHVNFEGLTAGTYTTQAEQSDAAGNIGVSQASTFSLTPPAVGPAPTATFTWVPSTPHVGQPVSLLSTSSDAASPISGYAWDLTGVGGFSPGAATNTTTFSSVGNHIVRLRVAAANGLSAVASETIAVTPATYPLMRPFPIVRIASIGTRSGIRLKLLRVQAPNGARISVTCRNRGCPARSQHMIARASADRVAAYVFRRFERALRPGVVLEVRVSGASQIGKYTRYTIRKGRLPQRVDMCLGAETAKPIACPSR